MGFYGNISNTAKTTFQFDRIFANRRDMEIAADSDSVYPGRYVLIDYSQTTNKNLYIPSGASPLASKEMYWIYNGKMYAGSPAQVTVNSGLFFEHPVTQQEVTTADGVVAGEMFLIPTGRRVSGLNETSKFIKVVQISPDTSECLLDSQVNYTSYLNWMDALITEQIEEMYEGRPVSEKRAALATALADTYVAIENMSPLTYEPNIFFFKNPDTDEFYLDDVGEFTDEKGTYYERKLTADMEVYFTANTDAASGLKFGSNILTVSGGLQEGHIYRIPKWHSYELNFKDEYWQARAINPSTNEIIWSVVVDDKNSDDNYFRNLSIDRSYVTAFGDSTGIGIARGYDATVWQKTIVNGQDKYVMIAELNSVVPTFDISYDPPTGVPLIPHFDKDSTNVYYKIHMQPQWGLRMKSAKDALLGPVITTNGVFGTESKPLTIDEVNYPSDQKVFWKSKFYNAHTGEDKEAYYSPVQKTWTETCDEANNAVQAAIYYNKLGFKPESVSYSADIFDETKSTYDATVAHTWKNEDCIKIEPTGKSGQLYKLHNGGTDMAPDTQELSIMLPSLGNAVAQMWDIVFGGRNTNEVINRTSMRNCDYEWEDAKGNLDRNGLRMVHYRGDKSYNLAEVNTLAGCINSVHDLMGMIITSDAPDRIDSNLENLDEDRIYYIQPTTATGDGVFDLQGQYTMKHKTYDYSPITPQTSHKPLSEEEMSVEDFDKTKYYVKQGDSFVKATATSTGPFYKLIQTIDVNDAYELIDEMEPWTAEYLYKDYNTKMLGETNPLKADYIKDEKYQQGYEYYTIYDGDKVKDPTNANHKDIELVELSGAYSPGTYFYEDTGHSYLIDTNNFSTNGRQYYTLNSSKIGKISEDGYQGIYVPGKYFYRIEETETNELGQEVTVYKYIKDMGTTPDMSRVYFTIKTSNKEDLGYVRQESYIPITGENIAGQIAQLLSTGNSVYLKVYSDNGQFTDGGGAYGYEIIDRSHQYDSNSTYAILQVIYVPAESQYEIDEDNPLILTPFKENTFFFEITDDSGAFKGYRPITIDEITPENEQKFIIFGRWGTNESGLILDSANSPYIAVTDEGKNRSNFAFIEQTAFYTPYVYHYMENGSYALDTYRQKTHNQYCLLTEVHKVDLSNRTFYEPGKYFAVNPVTGEYELVYDMEMPEDITEFYKGDKYYVLKDDAGIYATGSEWDMSIGEIPEGVTLAKRTERWELIPLKGFARNLNTIHGLIVKINQMLLAGDLLTRDTTTVQGVINKMNDLITRFHELTPERILAVDNYGRARGMDWTTDQSVSASKTKALDSDKRGIAADKFAKVADTTDDMYKQWITVNVDGNVLNPQISVHHNFQKVKDSLGNTKNMNVAEANIATDDANKITLQTPFIDEMGHMVGRKETTYTLPFGFKTIKTNGRSTGETENASSNPTTTSVAADCTQDILTINSGNKWIRIDTDGTNDSLTISHDIHNFAADGTVTASLSSETSKAVTFDTITYDFDKAGHFTGKTIKTITMPYGYGKIVGDSGTTSASATFDTLTFATDDWMTATVTADKVTFSHDYSKKEDDTTSTSNVNGNGDTITLETLARDEKGHITKVNQNTVTLPFGYKVFTDSNATVGKSTAANTQDTFVFQGDSWLKPIVTQGKATFEHIGPVSSTYTAKQNVTPKFGETFTIEDWFFDNKGHKFQGTTHTVKIPALSLTNDTSGNVVTGISFTPDTGTFVETKADLASLELNVVYEIPDETELEDFDDKDKTIAWLFKKVAQLEALIKDLGIAESETV